MKDKKADVEKEELNNKYLRALADYQNLEKQTQAWREDFVKFANQNLIIELLEVLDDLEKANEHLNDEGLKIVLDKLRKILENSGLEELDLLNTEYDPNTSEAVGMEAGEQENMVVKINKKGYKLNGKIIRVAKVIVSKKKEDSTDS